MQPLLINYFPHEDLSLNFPHVFVAPMSFSAQPTNPWGECLKGWYIFWCCFRSKFDQNLNFFCLQHSVCVEDTHFHTDRDGEVVLQYINSTSPKMFRESNFFPDKSLSTELSQIKRTSVFSLPCTKSWISETCFNTEWAESGLHLPAFQNKTGSNNQCK